MLYGEKMKQILEKFNIDTSVLPDSLYSTLLDAIYNVEISGEGGIDTSSATATTTDILKDKTAYAKGVKITGTIESKGAETYTPNTTDTVINSGVYLSGNQTIKGDTNLIADNIKKDVTIFGVTGTLDDSGAGGSNDVYELYETPTGTTFPKHYLKTVTIPNGCTHVDKFAFYNCTNLEKVIIPEGVTNINDNAFTFSKNLTVIIPKSVISIGASFNSTTNITINYAGSQNDWKAIDKHNNWALNAKGMTIVYENST